MDCFRCGAVFHRESASFIIKSLGQRDMCKPRVCSDTFFPHTARRRFDRKLIALGLCLLLFHLAKHLRNIRPPTLATNPSPPRPNLSRENFATDHSRETHEIKANRGRSNSGAVKVKKWRVKIRSMRIQQFGSCCFFKSLYTLILGYKFSIFYFFDRSLIVILKIR